MSKSSLSIDITILMCFKSIVFLNVYFLNIDKYYILNAGLIVLSTHGKRVLSN